MNIEQKERAQQVSPKRLWFGFAGGAASWIFAGLLNVLLAWQSCMGGEAGSAMFTQTWVWVVLGIITIGLLATGIAAGVVSYDNWRTLSGKSDFSEAEGRGREEYMAMVGVFVSVSLVAGIVWFAIPIYIIRMCVRSY
ncbi:MAG: hypothetical protein ACRD3E_03405 [Terriglobales bacterium]